MSLEFTFICPLANGFHARPASHLAAIAGKFACDCALTNLRNGVVADMKSVLSVIAADIRINDRCSARLQGPDEQAAGAELQHFVENDLVTCDVPLPDLSREGNSKRLPRSLQSATINPRFGLAASRGIGQGKAVVIGSVKLMPEPSSTEVKDPAWEEQQIRRALAAVRTRIQTRLGEKPSATEAAILAAHLAIMDDAALTATIREQVATGNSAAQAVVEASRILSRRLRSSENPYIRERAIDVEGIFLELLEKVSSGKHVTAVSLTAPSIVIAENLTPQQLLALDRKWLRGLVLESAGTTSHTVILARSLAIPALVGVKDVTSLQPGTEILVDANRGFLIAERTPAVGRFYEREIRTLERRKAAWARHAKEPAHTSDGHAIQVAANVSSADELESVFASGADGIGVLRTEMLFVGRKHAPSEQEQHEIYAEAARLAGNKPVVIRTIDVGGDKALPYLEMPAEQNPFLGKRGVRLYRDHQELLRTQLCAVLRAFALGRFQLLAPMMSSVEEVLWFKQQVAEVKKELEKQRIDFDHSIPLGIMVEVPSVAFMLDELCAEVDFFSIGTNDLSQYFFAADRGNPAVAGLANVRHPSFLKFLQQIVTAVRKHGKPVSMCGDMAADVRNLPLLLALELDEISVPGTEIPVIKEHIGRLSFARCRELLSQALACRTAAEVESLLDRVPVQSSRSLLDRELILVSNEAATKEDAIRQMIDALYADGRTDDPDELEEAIWKRESVYSTGLGHGLAIPHCKTDVVSSGSIAVLKLKKPVDWDSLDGKPVQMVILLAARESDCSEAHLRVFSQLSRNLMDENFREQLLRADDPDMILSVLGKDFESLPKVPNKPYH